MEHEEHRPDPATSVITRVVRAGHEDAFEEWLHGISREAATFPGHHSVTIFRPQTGGRQYTIVLQFDRRENLERWLDSDARRESVERSNAFTEVHESRAEVTGLEHWFTLPGKEEPRHAPRMKMVLLTALVVYPTILALNAVLAPILRAIPPLLGPLVVTVALTLLLTYLLMPGVTRLFYKWLYPGEIRERRGDGRGS